MRGRTSVLLTTVIVFVSGLTTPALEALDVLVSKTGSSSGKISLDFADFRVGGGGGATVFRRTVEADLVRSGYFSIVPSGGIRVGGGCEEAGGSVQVACQVMNLAKSEVCLNKNYKDDAMAARRLAHKVADEILFAVKGIRGIASTRIAMISKRTGSKELYLCDADGSGIRQLTNDGTISLSPAWGPDGSQLVYTSFKRGYADAYLVDLRSGSRTCIANYPGINTPGGLGPNGLLLLILSKDGNPEVYSRGVKGGALSRLTTTQRAAEASPCWSPDGSQIAYVSDSSGSPHVYVMTRGGAGRRLTTRGTQNVAPDWGPNGLIAYASLRGGLFRIYVINPATGEDVEVSPPGSNYEDPSWAPDGRHIACARTDNHHSRIYVLDVLKDPPIVLTNESGDWLSPAWSKQ